jgi:hypothetical protein
MAFYLNIYYFFIYIVYLTTLWISQAAEQFMLGQSNVRIINMFEYYPNIHLLLHSKPIRLSDGLIFVGEEVTEFQQLFAGAYCLSRHGENYIFYP